MAVTLTLTELAASMRLGDGVEAPTPPLDGILTRLLAVAIATVERLAPDAPDDIQAEAVIRMAAYAYDSPTAGRNTGFASAWHNSGASAMCVPWIVRRAR